MPKILFVCNDAWFFASHRLPIAAHLAAGGWDTVATARHDAAAERIKATGTRWIDWPISPRGASLTGELRSFWRLRGVIQRERPDIVHLITIKPVLYGGVLSRLLRVPGCVYAVSGLGALFAGDTVRGRFLGGLIRPVYRYAVGHPNGRLVFQNDDDRKRLLQTIKAPGLGTVLIRGSGVSLDDFTGDAEPTGVPVVTLAARLLRDKGIVEFVEAARRLRADGVQAIFQVAGGNAGAGNPAAWTDAELQELQQDDAVRWLGQVENMRSLFSTSNLVVLPSYREGLPKVLVEAGAAARAIVTTDVPGCRDAIDPGVTGLLVPPRDVDSLAEAMRQLIENPAQRAAMGAAGRALVKEEMGIDRIVQAHLDLYETLLASANYR